MLPSYTHCLSIGSISLIVNESISADKIICPNCGKEYPSSAKLLDILNTAKEIPKGDLMSEEFPIRAISENEDMNTTLH